MILLDTNVLIYASTDSSPFLEWARRTIAEAVSQDGAAVNAVGLAEICVGDAEPEAVAAHALLAGASLLLGLGLVLGSRVRARRVRAPRV